MKKQEKAAMLTKAVVLAAAFSVLPFPLSVRADALAAAESGEESGRENSGQEEEQSEPAVPRNQWTYQAEGNVWYYYGRDQERVRGRQLIHGETYFFDEEGNLTAQTQTAHIVALYFKLTPKEYVSRTVEG